MNISVSVNTGDDVEITIYDVVCQIIKRQSDRVTYSGTYHTVWDGKNGVGGVCERGVYFVHIAVNGEVDTYKVEKKD